MLLSIRISSGTGNTLTVCYKDLDGDNIMVFWFTGLSGAGKTTLATFLAEKLRFAGIPVLLLDGDVARQNLCAGLGFSMEDRQENIRRIASCAALAEDSGLVVCVACISPLGEHRNMARHIVRQYREIYLACPLEGCQKRDPKGLYKKAELGLKQNFTGISSVYEIPQNSDLILDTWHSDIAQTSTKLFDYAMSALAADDNPVGTKVKIK